jgi:alcohol dehydrogenase YqhD (iron-dependent ADH family)
MSMKTAGSADHFNAIHKKGRAVMKNFEFSVPTKIIFGAGEIKRAGEQAALFGKKALLVTFDEKHVKELGFYDKVMESCKKAGVELLCHFGVKSNPTAEHAAPAIALAKKEKPDVIIALGGGSAMDEAKFIGIAAKYDGDPWDFPTGKAAITEMVPIIAVVTIPATSSEINGISVMNNEELRRKDGFLSPIMRPSAAILDPELTYTVPIRRTAYSAADIVAHLLEHYLGHQLAFTPYQDHFCEGGIRSIMECMDRLLVNPQDPEARAIMMWQASFAWCGFYDCGFGLVNSNIHILGHSLSNFYDTPHGAAMSITILATLRYYLKQRTAKYARFAREVFGIRDTDDMIAATAGIAALEAWFRKIGTPVNFAEAGITDPAAIDKMAPDALLTARAWGEEEAFGYSEKIMREQFELCR